MKVLKQTSAIDPGLPGKEEAQKHQPEYKNRWAELQKQLLSHDHDFLAYFLQALACIIWTSSYLYTNQHNFNVFQVNIAKGVVGTALNYLVLVFKGNGIKFEESNNFKWLLILNICILAYFYGLPLSQFYLPLPIVHTIGCSSIAIIYIIDYFLNGARITRHGAIGVACALAGVMLMANNRLIMSLVSEDTFNSKFNNYRDSSVLFCSFIAFVLFLTRIINCYALVKFKSFPSISVFELNLHNNILGTFTAALGYICTSTHIPMSLFWPSYLTLGLGQFLCMTLFFYSLKITKKTGNVMVINALNIVVAFFISYFRYGEQFNGVLVVGAVGIFLGMVIVILETKKNRGKVVGDRQGKG